jgi:hypothetical protein
MTEIVIACGAVLIFAAYQSGREGSWVPLAGWAGFLAFVLAASSLP